VLRALMDKHPVDGWVGEYDGGTLEGALGLKADLNASADENRRLQNALELQAAEGERARAQLEELAARQLAEVEELAARQLAEVKAKNEQQRIQLDAMLASTSWRLTAPVRASSRCLSALGLFSRRK